MQQRKPVRTQKVNGIRADTSVCYKYKLIIYIVLIFYAIFLC